MIFAPSIWTLEIDGKPTLAFEATGYGPAGRPEAFRTRPVLHKPVLISKLGEAINSILSI
jgi:hypothetical protein